ncbi:uncharacterized protein P174DRAFT_416783 [Aspergillus novofumigatus IBT 16806]|uniref:Uncharacterized protein n=1 Tax=Aspergillus novofumigatus (strain IBT 16806) TaxID=1392255 RepID=A0A2I1CN80_ASPN1|nr:uncharacterized protein P174DRAFT_416783 [Aspergillus novofumigatus IBT 16806]PKX99084.1 hypothetical protein P174DRAFT_416783 [Aspergillus novofumigatus IBT 16806]
MEPVRMLIERPIPRLKQYRGTTNLSASGEGISARFIRATVFIRQTEDFRFDYPFPIDEQAAIPSLRQCFLPFAYSRRKPVDIKEAPDFNHTRLKIPWGN